mmetsp:Transcript_83057/g.144210  ORF Transcript_83057/g.144210 Transcript_83057/m.144210 type:complete len:276 (-) Transcript_83057:10-837(-)
MPLATGGATGYHLQLQQFHQIKSQSETAPAAPFKRKVRMPCPARTRVNVNGRFLIEHLYAETSIKFPSWISSSFVTGRSDMTLPMFTKSTILDPGGTSSGVSPQGGVGKVKAEPPGRPLPLRPAKLERDGTVGLPQGVVKEDDLCLCLAGLGNAWWNVMGKGPPDGDNLALALPGGRVRDETVGTGYGIGLPGVPTVTCTVVACLPNGAGADDMRCTAAPGLLEGSGMAPGIAGGQKTWGWPATDWNCMPTTLIRRLSSSDAFRQHQMPAKTPPQ